MVKNVIINIILYYIIDNNYYCIFSIRMFCSWSAGGATAKPRKGFINRYSGHEVVFTNVFKAEGKLTCGQIRAVVFSLRCCGCSQSADVCVLVVRCRTTVCLLLLVFLYFCHRSCQCLSFGVFRCLYRLRSSVCRIIFYWSKYESFGQTFCHCGQRVPADVFVPRDSGCTPCPVYLQETLKLKFLKLN